MLKSRMCPQKPSRFYQQEEPLQFDLFVFRKENERLGSGIVILLSKALLDQHHVLERIVLKLWKLTFDGKVKQFCSTVTEMESLGYFFFPIAKLGGFGFEYFM